METDPSHLDQPFFVMHKVAGRVPPDIALPDGWRVRDLEPADQVALQKASIATMAGIGIDIDGKADFLEYDSALGETPLRRHFAVEKAYYEWTCEGAGRLPHD